MKKVKSVADLPPESHTSSLKALCGVLGLAQVAYSAQEVDVRLFKGLRESDDRSSNKTVNVVIQLTGEGVEFFHETHDLPVSKLYIFTTQLFYQ